jgi:heme exporter protein CcmD
MNEFFAMGGYAAFVWPCFLLAAIVLVWNVVAARRLLNAAQNRVLRSIDTGKGRR